MKLPPGFVSRAVLTAYARKAGLTYEQFRRCDDGLEEWPPGHEAAILEVFEPLTSPGEDSTLNTVNTTVSSNALRSRARLSEGTRKSKATRILSKKGITFAEVADDLTKKLRRKVPRSTVQSWFKAEGDESRRPIPQDAADALAGEPWGIPPSSWFRIIPTP